MAMSQLQVIRNGLMLHLYLTASGVEANYYRSYQNEIIVKVIFKSINATFYNILTLVLDP